MAVIEPRRLFSLSMWEVVVILIGSLIGALVISNANTILLQVVVIGPLVILFPVLFWTLVARRRNRSVGAFVSAVVIADRWFVKKIVGGVAYWAAFTLWLVALRAGSPAYFLGIFGNIVIIGFLLVAVFVVNLTYVSLTSTFDGRTERRSFQIWRSIKKALPVVALLIGLIVGSLALAFSLDPPSRPSSSPVAFPPIFDVGVATYFPLPSTPDLPYFNETDYYFESSRVFLNLTFTHVSSNSDVLVLMPFKINNVTTPFGFGSSTLNKGWKFSYQTPNQIGQNYWIENATFSNAIYPSAILNGSLAMELTLDNDIFNVGPWQKSVLLSLGSNTSPLTLACARLRSCLSAYSGGSHRQNAASFVEIDFNKNEILGDGTFPTPTLVASNNYTRGVAWTLPSSPYFHDIQLFIVGNTFVWAYPVPSIYQPMIMTFGFVVLQVVFTKIFVDLTKRPAASILPETQRRSLGRCISPEFL